MVHNTLCELLASFLCPLKYEVHEADPDFKGNSCYD